MKPIREDALRTFAELGFKPFPESDRQFLGRFHYDDRRLVVKLHVLGANLRIARQQNNETINYPDDETHKLRLLTYGRQTTENRLLCTRSLAAQMPMNFDTHTRSFFAWRQNLQSWKAHKTQNV
jgi:hypothetical protein